MKWSFRRSPPRLRRVTLYHRPGCHLCDDALALLHRLNSSYPMAITCVDIRSEPALLRRYDIRIPVIVIDQSVELEAPIDEKKLRKALR